MGLSFADQILLAVWFLLLILLLIVYDWSRTLSIIALLFLFFLLVELVLHRPFDSFLFLFLYSVGFLILSTVIFFALWEASSKEEGKAPLPVPSVPVRL